MMARQCSVDTVRICLCRDRLQALESALHGGAYAVIGCQKGWHAPERRLARKLRRDGLELILTEPE